MVSVETALHKTQKCEALCEGRLLCTMHCLALNCSWSIEERPSQLICVLGNLHSNTYQLAAPGHKLGYFIKFSCVATPGGAVSQLMRNFKSVFLRSAKRKKLKDVLQVSS